jgi:N-acetylneuraminic acid mutarotase
VYRVLDVYDFARDRWTKGPRMSVGRHHLAAAAVDGNLYAVGGRSNRSLALGDVERYDPRAATWERVASLPLGSGGLEAVAWDGRLIVLGGGDDKIGGWVTPATWSLDPETERWTRLGDMIVPRHGFGATIADGRLYALGGAPCARYGQTPAVESMPLS